MDASRLFFRSIFVCLFIYLFILQLHAIWAFTIDDMYITLRYASNWAQGFGLVWNVGEPPVEGYSNFIFVVLARVALFTGVNPVIALKSAGVIGLFFTCAGVYKLSRFWTSPSFALIPCAWLLFYRGEILWSISGLETAVFQALLCSVVFFIFKGFGYRTYPQKQQKIQRLPFITAGFLLALAGITRPETTALMLLFVLLIALNKPTQDFSRYLQGVILFCGTLFICFAPYFFWRWHYYGWLFPNSVYCKGNTGVDYFMLDKNYLKLIWPFILLAIPAVWKSGDRRHYFLWTPSVLYLVLLFDADPIVAFENRLFLPAFALLLPLALQGLQRLITHYLQRQDQVYEALLFMTAFLLAFFLIPSLSLPGYKFFSQNPVAGEQLRQQVVRWLAQNTATNDQIVLGDSGLIPFAIKRQFIDSYCLNNEAMAHDSSLNRYENFCRQILMIQPEVIILTSAAEKGQVYYAPSDACLAQELQVGNNYCRSINFSTNIPYSSYRYEIFTKGDCIHKHKLDNKPL